MCEACCLGLVGWVVDCADVCGGGPMREGYGELALCGRARV